MEYQKLKKYNQEKIYISYEQVSIEKDRIYVYLKGKDEPICVNFISSDSNGLYVIVKLKKCGFGQGHCNIHPLWCPFCEGCAMLYCPNSCCC